MGKMNMFERPPRLGLAEINNRLDVQHQKEKLNAMPNYAPIMQKTLKVE